MKKVAHFSKAILAGTGAFIAIGLLSWANSLTSEFVWLMAPFGATAVLVFGVPDSPLASPKNVIVGHLLCALIGLLFVTFTDVTPLTLALASGLAISLMLLTRTTHPPAGANPLLIMLTGQSWWFLLDPVLVGSVCLVVLAQLWFLLKQRWVPLAE